MTAFPAAEFDKVSKVYTSAWPRRQSLQALADISFQIETGHVFGLLGPNRAGKTTLVKILLSLVHVTSGQATRLGEPVSNRRTLGRIGYLHENHAFPTYLTPVGLLEYYGALSLLPGRELRLRIPQLLDQVGLADRASEPLQRFSKGMVQRLGLAQALLTDPDLLVLDEPTEGLDLAGRELLRDVLATFRRRGRTVLLVSHVLTEVEQVCDRIAVVIQGRLAFVGAIKALLGETDKADARSLEQALKALYEKSSS